MNRRAGATPALTEDEIDDIVAFLRTLTDARYVAQMPDPAVDKARSAHAPRAGTRTAAIRPDQATTR